MCLLILKRRHLSPVSAYRSSNSLFLSYCAQRLGRQRPRGDKTRYGRGGRLESYGVDSMYITYTNAVHMSHQGLSGTSVGGRAHTTFW